MSESASLARALADRYELLRELGRGGMAIVYLARDVRHARQVAIKVLHPELAAVLGAERFLAEITTTANLQHPHILPLHDSGVADGFLFYVMPFVEGETLRARLEREQQLPIDDAVRIAREVLSALDYAHRHGVIHRDIKPENVLLHDGSALVADFGIALAVTAAGGQRMTQTGLSLGTPQYMSPEQAMGERQIDGRADVYAAGAVLYEMLTGEPPHLGNSAQAIIAKLMTENPRPLSVLRPSVPPHVDDAVRCALQKLPADRFATAAEFADALRGTATSLRFARETPAADTRRQRMILRGALAASSLLAVLLASLLVRERSRPQPPPFRFAVDLPPGQRIAITQGSVVTMAPDGRSIAYVASTLGAAAPRIFIRPLDSLYPRSVGGTEGGDMPRFSPDGQWLAFRTNVDLRRVPLSGGDAEIMTARMAGSQNFALGPKGDVVLARDGSLWRIGEKSASTRLTTPDTARGEIGHAGPVFIDDESIAFWIQKPSSDGTIRGVGITSLSGGAHAALDVPGGNPLGYFGGHLLLSSQNGSLMAYPFDIKSRRLTGAPTSVLDSVVWIAAGGPQANIGRDGSLVYLRGSSGRRFAMLDARGVSLGETPELRDYRAGSIAPDGKRVAVAIGREMMGGRNNSNSDLWIWDVESRALVRLTTNGGWLPAWSADGTRIAFIRSTAGSAVAGGARSEAWWIPADGSSPEQQLRFPGLDHISAIRLAPSGKLAVVVVQDSVTSDDLYLVNLATPDAAPVPLAHSRFREIQPLISPDGRWLAYRSDETGRFELYVQPLERPGPRLRVSTAGAGLAVWGSNGKRLIYYAENGATLAATLAFAGTSLRVARLDTISLGGGAQFQDLEPRTNRVLVVHDPEDRRIIVVPNWVAEVKGKLARN